MHPTLKRALMLLPPWLLASAMGQAGDLAEMATTKLLNGIEHILGDNVGKVINSKMFKMLSHIPATDLAGIMNIAVWVWLGWKLIESTFNVYTDPAYPATIMMMTAMWGLSMMTTVLIPISVSRGDLPQDRQAPRGRVQPGPLPLTSPPLPVRTESARITETHSTQLSPGARASGALELLELTEMNFPGLKPGVSG